MSAPTQRCRHLILGRTLPLGNANCGTCRQSTTSRGPTHSLTTASWPPLPTLDAHVMPVSPPPAAPDAIPVSPTSPCSTPGHLMSTVRHTITAVAVACVVTSRHASSHLAAPTILHPAHLKFCIRRLAPAAAALLAPSPPLPRLPALKRT